MSGPSQDSRRPFAASCDRHLWQIQPVRDAFLILLIYCILRVGYWARAWLVPVALAFALAYLVQPLVLKAKEKWRIPRTVSATAVLVLFCGAVAAFAYWAWPKLVPQVESLLSRAPEYAAVMAEKLQSVGRSAATQPASAALTTRETLNGWIRDAIPDSSDGLVTTLGRLFGFVGNVLSTGVYLLTSLVIVLVLFVCFAARFDALHRLKKYLPASRRERTWELLGKIGRAFGAFVRGQFIVAAFTTTGFLIGFWLANVPYWFVVGLVGGTLSLIPYGQMVGLLLAVLLKYAETQTGDATFSWFGVVVAPCLVYAVTQSAESWVITPLVQSGELDMHPMVVLVVLLFGGALAGILGLILAIPVAASVQILFHEEVRPRLRHWSDVH